MSVRDRGSLKEQWAALPWGVRRSISRDVFRGRLVEDLALRDVAAWRAHRLAVEASVVAVAYAALFVAGASLELLHVLHRSHHPLPLRLLAITAWILLLWWTSRRCRRAATLNASGGWRASGSG